MASEGARQAVAMIRTHRWGGLATAIDGEPMASMVSYAVEPSLGLLMFLSGLARHARNLNANPVASLVVTVADGPDVADPQTLARVSVQGSVERIARDDAGFAAAWLAYVERFPSAESRLGLGDFTLYRLVPESARFIGGFGAARTIKGDALREAAAAGA
jgi:putative heme iron utilization protein